MQTLIVRIDTAEHAKNLTYYLKKAKGVKSVIKENGKYDWLNPSRPATEEEVEAMIAKAERDMTNNNILSSEEARALTLQKISRWKKKRNGK